jgi:CHAT domain-containing protein/tetratricopeptide (TPR) repeat protein
LPNRRAFHLTPLLTFFILILTSPSFAQKPAIDPAVDSLAGSLSQAGSGAERESLLANKPDKVTRELLDLLLTRGDQEFMKANYTGAFNLIESSRLVAERLGDKSQVANAWLNLGVLYFAEKRYQQALESYQKSMTLFEELGRKTEAARLLTSMALVQSALGQPKLSLDYFQRGLKVHEELGDVISVAGVLDNIGTLYYEQNNYALASENYRKALAIYIDAGVTDVVANQLLKIAELEYEQGNDETALNYYQQALVKYDEVKNKRSRSYVLHTIANFHYTQGDYPQALGYYQASLKTAEESGNKAGAVGALLGIGLVHSLTGDHAQSLEAYEKNLGIAQSLGNKEALATAYGKVGGAHYNLLDYAKALEFYQKELAVREGIGNQEGLAGSLLDIGIVYTARGEYDKALDHYQRSKEKFEATSNRKGVATALLNSCEVFYLLADFAKTIEVSGQAADIAQQSGDMDLYWQARHRAGKAYYKSEQLDAAKVAFADAITTIETKIPLISNTQQPRFFSENKFAPYLGMVDVLIAKGQGNEAFNYAERARARALLVILHNAKVWINKTMTPAELERERKFLTEIATLSNRIYREMELSAPNQERIAALKSSRSKRQLEYDSFKKGLYARHPMLKAMRGEGQPLTATQAVGLASDPRTALLNFVETDERAYLFAFAKNRTGGKARGKETSSIMPALKIYVLNTNRADLDARISAYRQLLESHSSEITELEAKGRELYDLLLKPAEGQLAGRSQLVIVPDGSLWNLPFQSLPTGQTEEPGQTEKMEDTGNGNYLITDYAVSYAPSMTTYRSLLTLRYSWRRSDNRELLAFGNPTSSEEGAERIRAILHTDKLEQLAETQGEVEELGKLYGKSGLIFAGADARAERFKTECGKYRILHLATRGVFSDVSPLFSPVAFSAGADTRNGYAGNDGLLEVRDLLNLNLKAELAVVSASDIPSIRGGGGRGMTGLSWAFFIAGCPSTLVSRWRPQSQAVTDLMLEFHRNLRTTRQNPRSSNSRARSWQLAVKKLIANEEYRHPYYWAGFELLGNGK